MKNNNDEDMLTDIGKRAKSASLQLARISTEFKNEALHKMAASLVASKSTILSANSEDVESMKRRGMKPALVDRLALDERSLKGMASCLREVAISQIQLGQ